MITLTTEQAQQIEEALNAATLNKDHWLEKCMDSLDTIRAARAPELPHLDDEAVDRFAVAMKAKLAKKRAEGRGGWEDKNQCSAELLNQLLNEHIGKGDPVDVGNLAMMLWNRGEHTEARAQERETVVCESCGETIPECQIAGEMESGGAACADCCVAFWIDRVAHLEEQHGINPAANQHPLIAYAESYEQMARVSSAKVDSLSVAIDIRQNMIPVTEDLNVLRTRNWTQEMSVAWHRAIPNLEKAFDDLIVAYNKGKK